MKNQVSVITTRLYTKFIKQVLNNTYIIMDAQLRTYVQQAKLIQPLININKAIFLLLKATSKNNLGPAILVSMAY